MVNELLCRIKKLLSREKDLLSKSIPLRDEEEAAEVYLQEMEETLLELRELGEEYFQDLLRISADKAKEKELLQELTFLQELHQQREENIALCREKLEFTEKELDRIKLEKKAHFTYQPSAKGRSSAFVDSKI